MFNSLLNRKEKMGYILFYWFLFIASIAFGIWCYKLILPQRFVENKTVTSVDYKIINQVELKDLVQGQSVKYMGKNLCVSTIDIQNPKNVTPYNPDVSIYLRQEGNCN